MGALMVVDWRRSVRMILAVTAVASLTAVTGSGGATAGTRAAAAPRAAIAVTWGAAQEMPGSAALSQGGDAQVNSVSCSSPGNCSAGGFYTDSAGGDQAFAASEVKGTWRAPHRSAGHRRPQQVRLRLDQLGVMHLGGQLQCRRVLREQRPSGVCRQRSEWYLA